MSLCNYWARYTTMVRVLERFGPRYADPAPGSLFVGRVEAGGGSTGAQHQQNQWCAKSNSRPRYHTYLLPSGSTDEGAFQGAFFRFEPDFLWSHHNLNLADQLQERVPGSSDVMSGKH